MEEKIDFTPEQVALVKALLAGQDLTDEELALFLYVAKVRGLNPLLREIYAVKRKTPGGPERMVVQTGIDGYRTIAERTGRYCPGETTFQETADGKLISATVSVLKLFDLAPGIREWKPVTATAFYREFVQTRFDQKEGRQVPVSMWAKMPRNQLAKCAEALALRKAFPQQLAALYTDAEMDQADSTPRELHEAKPAALEAPAVQASIRKREGARAPALADREMPPETKARLDAAELARQVAIAEAPTAPPLARDADGSRLPEQLPDDPKEKFLNLFESRTNALLMRGGLYLDPDESRKIIKKTLATKVRAARIFSHEEIETVVSWLANPTREGVGEDVRLEAAVDVLEELRRRRESFILEGKEAHRAVRAAL